MIKAIYRHNDAQAVMLSASPLKKPSNIECVVVTGCVDDIKYFQ